MLFSLSASGHVQRIKTRVLKHYALTELRSAEWEALCDGCGLCCLVKLEDEESQEVAYTKVACKLLDCQTASCRDYPNRKQHVPDCIQLTPELLGHDSLVTTELCTVVCMRVKICPDGTI